MAMTRFFVALALVPLVCGFSPNKVARLPRTILSVIDEEAVAASVSVDQIPRQTAPVASTPPPPAPVVSVDLPPPEPTTTAVQVSPPPPAPEPVQPSTWSNEPAAVGGDLPLPIIGAGVLAAFAAVTFAMRGRDEVAEEQSVAASTTTATSTTTSTSTTTASSSSASAPDLSIPYDAAARLAYEKAGGTGDYEAFKAKYEADAIADVIAKKK